MIYFDMRARAKNKEVKGLMLFCGHVILSAGTK